METEKKKNSEKVDISNNNDDMKSKYNYRKSEKTIA